MQPASTSSYAIAQGDQGASRLEFLTRLTWPDTYHFLKKLPLEGKHCLEPGCGAGAVSAHLLELLGDNGRLTAFDIDPASVTIARKNIPDPRVEFKVRDLSTDHTAPDEQYDIIFCRFILEHIHNPAETIEKLKEWLKPGGMLIAEDIDAGGFFCHPDSEYFQQFRELLQECIRVRGGDPQLGFKLPVLFKSAGFIDLEIEVVNRASLDDDVKQFSLITLDAFRDSLIDEKLLNEADFLKLRERLSEFYSNTEVLHSLARTIQCAGIKPHE